MEKSPVLTVWANTFFCGGSRFRRCYFYCSIKLYRLRYVGMVLISHRYSYTVKHSNVYSSVSLTPRRTKISLRFPLFKHLFFVFLVQCISNIHVPHIFFYNDYHFIFYETRGQNLQFVWIRGGIAVLMTKIFAILKPYMKIQQSCHTF